MNNPELTRAQANTVLALQKRNHWMPYSTIEAFGGNGASLSFLVREGLAEEKETPVLSIIDGSVNIVRQWRLKK